MTRRGLWLVAAVALLAAALVMAQRPQPKAKASPAGASSAQRPPVAAQPAPPVDPAAIRDVFRFADRPARVAPRPQARSASAAVPSPPSDLPRLVGLVRRQGRLLAAFAIEGDVVLAGPGETVAGVTVLEVSEEGVKIRRPDGSEERLALP